MGAAEASPPSRRPRLPLERAAACLASDERAPLITGNRNHLRQNGHTRRCIGGMGKDELNVTSRPCLGRPREGAMVGKIDTTVEAEYSRDPNSFLRRGLVAQLFPAVQNLHEEGVPKTRSHQRTSTVSPESRVISN
jgi:hypothetical protein